MYRSIDVNRKEGDLVCPGCEGLKDKKWLEWAGTMMMFMGYGLWVVGYGLWVR